MQPQIWNIVALAVLCGINFVSPLPQNSIWEVILGEDASSEEQPQDDDISGESSGSLVNSLLFGLGGAGDGGGGRVRGKNARKYVVVDPSLEMGCLDEGTFPVVGDCTRFLLCRKSPFGMLRGWRYRCPEGFHYGGASGFYCLRVNDMARLGVSCPWNGNEEVGGIGAAETNPPPPPRSGLRDRKEDEDAAVGSAENGAEEGDDDGSLEWAELLLTTRQESSEEEEEEKPSEWTELLFAKTNKKDEEASNERDGGGLRDLLLLP